tara:strand:+ start:17932 stop:18333 length:402 start_codon:yes stop_codon:yes gene_type:complete
MATEKQIEAIAKQYENYLNRELREIYGLEDICLDSKLEEDAETIIRGLDDCKSFFSKSTIKHLYLSTYQLCINNDVFIDITLHKESYGNIEQIEKYGRIESLKRVGMIKEYKKEFKNNIINDLELNTFYVFVS